MILKNKKADIANFLGKTSLNKEVTFLRKVKSKSEYLLLKNKKADIAITILVVVVAVLCTTALLGFSSVKNKQTEKVVNSAQVLRNVYNLADSVEYSKESGAKIITMYNKEEDASFTVGNIKITKKAFDGDLKVVYTYSSNN